MAHSIDRRTLLVGGGVGVGLIVAWAAWPRAYPVNLVANADERVFGAWLKIGTDGHVTVAVPQAEHGQGVYTVLPQIVADELGADWRTVGVEAAPVNPLYANPLGLRSLLEGTLDALPAGMIDEAARRAPVMLTGGSSSVRMFEEACRHAGAAARSLLCKAAARRWDVAWTECGVDAGFVVHQGKRLRFADLAAAAAMETVPDPLPADAPGTGKLIGQSVPRIDVPAKVDGSANFAGDIRLPDMVHAAIRQAPQGDSRLVAMDRDAARRVRGVVAIVDRTGWVAVVATTWWAAERGLAALAPRFETTGPVATTATIDAALTAAFDGPGTRMAKAGDVAGAFRGARIVTAEYRVAPGLHAAIETSSATAHWHGGRLELWLPTQAPANARRAAAQALGIGEGAVVVHPMLVGGGFGDRIETGAAAQAAVIAKALERPVALVWSRTEACLNDRCRPPAAARMAARLAPNGAILGWSAAIAAPATGKALAKRLMPGIATDTALALGSAGDAYAVAGALPPYRIPNYAIDHHPATIGIETGHLRGGAHGYTAFFTECFLDELAHVAGTEALSYRIGMLGGDARLARCLSTAASLGGWDGGVAGSGQGIACHAFRGSYIAVLAEAHVGEDGRPVVDRLVAAVDCGRVIHPDIVRQQVEGGLIFGTAMALGASTGFAQGLATVTGFGGMGLPILDDAPDVTVEVIRSDETPGGVGELGVPAVAPAIANALQSATGVRIRSLPLRRGG